MSSLFSKKLQLEKLAGFCEDLRSDGSRIVTTNGCFDILHLGHIRYLEAAKKLGDILIVGVNSDTSVQALGKGPGRPVFDEQVRMEQLAALQCVDFVVLFKDATPLKFIEAAKPDVHVKGADYEGKDIPERALLSGMGAQLKFMPFTEGYSSTDLIGRLKLLS